MAGVRLEKGTSGCLALLKGQIVLSHLADIGVDPGSHSLLLEVRFQILVIEDDPIIQSIIDEAIRDGGYEPAVAASGEEAVILLKRRLYEYRVLVTDINLKGQLNGWEVARAARAIDPAFPSFT
jgi:response regulator RpfG family c-di-GMP phosphodiesterase